MPATASTPTIHPVKVPRFRCNPSIASSPRAIHAKTYLAPGPFPAREGVTRVARCSLPPMILLYPGGRFGNTPNGPPFPSGEGGRGVRQVPRATHEDTTG